MLYFVVLYLLYFICCTLCLCFFLDVRPFGVFLVLFFFLDVRPFFVLCFLLPPKTFMGVRFVALPGVLETALGVPDSTRALFCQNSRSGPGGRVLTGPRCCEASLRYSFVFCIPRSSSTGE